uniref:Cytochrome c biogenesis protein CcsA n=1 Tax=Chlorodesmis fastigiata TaxID=189431 RepID=A0A2P0QHC0_CHLFS|nr:cytochrome c biogenesis protein ccs1 [Chlorodesmis fastigiata]ARO74174.1 cytochrome c biogenesis protein ccs1 [Chlorodesmis fastigiata]
MENLLNNSSFFFLFCSMVFYWIRAFFNISIFSSLGKKAIIGGNLSMFFLLIFRGIQEKHFPLSNLSWSLTFIHLIYSNFQFSDFIIGSILAPTALFLNAFASFQIPESLQKLSPLIPALQSNWLMMHVTVMLLSYATLIFGSILSIVFLFLFQSFSLNILLNQLDQLSFRSIGIGFPLLTVGILSGSVWANEAWGSYWSWDPKETWSLVTWIVFATYLHLRLTQQWDGYKSAILGTVGFFAVWICFLGVNFLAKGFHSYGWFH